MKLTRTLTLMGICAAIFAAAGIASAQDGRIHKLHQRTVRTEHRLARREAHFGRTVRQRRYHLARRVDNRILRNEARLHRLHRKMHHEG